MIVYISGKITGNPTFKDDFETAERDLKKRSDVSAVLNPAILPKGLTQAQYMRICLAMLDCADSILMLPDWQESQGAIIEKAYAEKIGLREVFLS